MRLKLVLPLLFITQAAFGGYETGPIDTILRVPHTIGRPKFGSIDLSKSAAVGSSKLGLVNGGCNGSTAATCFDNISPLTSIGDLIYGGAAGTRTRLAGNTTTTTKVLSQTGDGVNSAAPVWSTSFVKSISKSGSTSLNGDVTLSPGTGITLNQVGQDITIAATASSTVIATGTALSNSNSVIVADTSSSAFTLTLHEAATASEKPYYITVDGNYPVTLARTGTNLIQGETSQILYPGNSVILIPNNARSKWYAY